MQKLRHQSFLLPLFLVFGFGLFAQKATVNISGYIKEQGSKEPLVGANIWLKKLQGGTSTNADGYFIITVPGGQLDTLVVSFVGYQPHKLPLHIRQDTLLTIQLNLSVSLDEVTIVADAPTLAQEQFGSTTLSGQQIESIPALLGESDVMRALQLTPGVQGGAEGSTGLFVRGGTPGQNLILLDGTTIYNTSHLFGFLSAFNPDAVKSVNLIRDGFPARYAGRLSSVVDVTMKDGNQEKHRKELSIGIISSRFFAEGPLKKQKTSYMAAVRTSYLSLIALPAAIQYRSGKRDELNSYWMYDVNLKLTHEISEREKISLSFFNGYDTWAVRQRASEDSYDFGLDWGNATLALRHTKALGKSLFLQNVVNYNYYNYRLINRFNSSDGKSSFINASSVRDFAGRSDLNWHVSPVFSFNAGIDLNNQYLRPGRTNYSGESQFLGADSTTQRGTQLNNLGAYLSQQFRPFKGLMLETGIRFNQYFTQEKQYSYLEPRLKLNYSWRSSQEAVQLSFSRMSQPIHLLSTNGAGLPNDVWIPATARFGPEQSWQVGGGYRWQHRRLGLELGLEGYYKEMRDLIDYRQGLDYFEVSGQPWQNLVNGEGRGRSYGAEFSLNKTKGKLTGSLSYTWSKTDRQTPGVNQNQWYPFRYDRRHDFALTAQYPLNNGWKIAGTFEYQTGAAVTLPVAIQLTLNESLVPRFVFGGRNNRRMPDYHRLDIGLSHTTENKRSGEAQTWSFGMYNAYGRLNPYYVDYTAFSYNQDGRRVIEGNFGQRTLFRFVPYLTWAKKF
jgi:outer membrane cobalamin receptor